MTPDTRRPTRSGPRLHDAISPSAARAAAVANGLCEPDCDVSVRCLGGELIVHYTPGAVTLTGDTRLVYTGQTEF